MVLVVAFVYFSGEKECLKGNRMLPPLLWWIDLSWQLTHSLPLQKDGGENWKGKGKKKSVVKIKTA